MNIYLCLYYLLMTVVYFKTSNIRLNKLAVGSYEILNKFFLETSQVLLLLILLLHLYICTFVHLHISKYNYLWFFSWFDLMRIQTYCWRIYTCYSLYVRMCIIMCAYVCCSFKLCHIEVYYADMYVLKHMYICYNVVQPNV